MGRPGRLYAWFADAWPALKSETQLGWAQLTSHDAVWIADSALRICPAVKFQLARMGCSAQEMRRDAALAFGVAMAQWANAGIGAGEVGRYVLANQDAVRAGAGRAARVLVDYPEDVCAIQSDGSVVVWLMARCV